MLPAILINPFVEKPFGRQTEMKQTIIIKCTKCGGLMMATKTQKTKICPYCGAHVNLEKAVKVAAAKDSFEASTILRKLKSEQGFPSRT